MAKPMARHLLSVNHDVEHFTILGQPYGANDIPEGEPFAIFFPSAAYGLSKSGGYSTTANVSDVWKASAAYGREPKSFAFDADAMLAYVRECMMSGKRFSPKNKTPKSGGYWPNTATNEPIPEPVSSTNVEPTFSLDDVRNIVEALVEKKADGMADAVMRTAMARVADALNTNLILIEEAKVAALEAVRSVQPTVINVPGNEPVTITARTHSLFPRLLRRVAKRKNVLLVGPAGTGKSTICEQVAEALGLHFASISCNALMSVADIRGFIHANGGYIMTEARKCYEHGGVFLLDEMDAGNPNVLVAMNAMLANGVYAFPDGMVKKHPDFIVIAAANTYGTGATAEYVGRNVIDAATRNRFFVLEMGIDEEIEREVTLSINPERGAEWLRIIRECRANAARLNVKCVISPRDAYDGADVLTDPCETFEGIANERFLSALDEGDRRKVLTGVVF